MNCPSCHTEMRRLVKDQLADWICDRCSSLWTDSYLNKLTASVLGRMHTDFLREQAYKQERYGNRQPEKPIKAVKRKELGKWMTNAGN